jgi:peptidoglycan/xylan/chitin deacetylase (PgdA/CDA1 family)
MKLLRWHTVSLFVLISITSCSFDALNTGDNNSGIVLGFDDYNPVTWEENFDLFDKYNARVTFFVKLDSPTPFCYAAQARGHEIGYHIIHHPNLSTLNKAQFLAETVDLIAVFAGLGINLTTFAYPYGVYEDWMHEELLRHYKVVRGFYAFHLYNRDDMKYGFIDSTSIDNTSYKKVLYL